MCYSGLYTKWLRKLLGLNGVCNKWGVFNSLRLLCRLLYHQGHIILHVYWVTEAVLFRDLVRLSYVSHIGDSWEFFLTYHCLQTTILPSKDSSWFWKLENGWVLSVTIWLELSIMRWKLFDPTNHKLFMYNCTSSNGKISCVIRPVELLWHKESIWGNWQAHGFCSCYTILCPETDIYSFIGHFLCLIN